MRRITLLFLVVCAACFCLSACDWSSPDPVPSPSVVPLLSPTAAIDASPVASPTPPPTLPPLLTPPPAGELPTYNDIKAATLGLKGYLPASGESQQHPQYQERELLIESELGKYWLDLQDKSVSGWEGWVVRTGVAARDSKPAFRSATENAVLIYMEDPYTTSPAPSTPVAPPYIEAYDEQYRESFALYVLLVFSRPSDAQQFQVGQKLRFDATIQLVSQSKFEDFGLVMGDVRSTVLEASPAAGATSTDPDIASTGIEIVRSSCFGFCPYYRATLYQGHLLVFEGISFTRILGFKMVMLPEATIKELVTTIEEADFFSLSDFVVKPDPDNVTVTLSVTSKGRTHTVEHYYSDPAAPPELVDLEDRVDELLGTPMWVDYNFAPSDTSSVTLPSLTAPSSIGIRVNWGGFGSIYSVDAVYTLDRVNVDYVGSATFSIGEPKLQRIVPDVRIPDAAVQAFLAKLATSPVERGEYDYKKVMGCCDNGHLLKMALQLADGSVIFESPSPDVNGDRWGSIFKGGARTPWAVDFRGERHIINSSEPGDAYEILIPYLKLDELAKLIEEAGENPEGNLHKRFSSLLQQQEADH